MDKCFTLKCPPKCFIYVFLKVQLCSCLSLFSRLEQINNYTYNYAPKLTEYAGTISFPIGFFSTPFGLSSDVM